MFENLKVVNLTQHPITVENDEGKWVFKPSGTEARVGIKLKEIKPGFYKQSFTEVENLPEPAENTIYIVSAMVLSGLKGRSDVYAPATSIVKRNEKGFIDSVPGLVQY